MTVLPNCNFVRQHICIVTEVRKPTTAYVWMTSRTMTNVDMPPLQNDGQLKFPFQTCMSGTINAANALRCTLVVTGCTAHQDQQDALAQQRKTGCPATQGQLLDATHTNPRLCTFAQRPRQCMVYVSDAGVMPLKRTSTYRALKRMS